MTANDDFDRISSSLARPDARRGARSRGRCRPPGRRRRRRRCGGLATLPLEATSDEPTSLLRSPPSAVAVAIGGAALLIRPGTDPAIRGRADAVCLAVACRIGDDSSGRRRRSRPSCRRRFMGGLERLRPRDTVPDRRSSSTGGFFELAQSNEARTPRLTAQAVALGCRRCHLRSLPAGHCHASTDAGGDSRLVAVAAADASLTLTLVDDCLRPARVRALRGRLVEDGLHDRRRHLPRAARRRDVHSRSSSRPVLDPGAAWEPGRRRPDVHRPGWLGERRSIGPSRSSSCRRAEMPPDRRTTDRRLEPSASSRSRRP